MRATRRQAVDIRRLILLNSGHLCGRRSSPSIGIRRRIHGPLRSAHRRPLAAYRGLSRRSILKGFAVGAAGVGAAPLLAACTGKSGGGSSSKSATVGSNYSDAVPKKAFAAMTSGFQTKSGDKVKINTVDHNSFQENINNYLQGSPDDAFTWFAGFRMRYYAKKGLVSDLNDVWDKIGGNFSDAFAQGVDR